MQAHKTGNVLIIDDDRGVVKIISAVFERMSLSFDHAENLENGLSRINSGDFDIVLLDVNLPDGDGIESIPYILDRERPPLVIIMTAYYSSNGAGLAIESGAWDYLPKPISSKELRLQVFRALEYQKQKREAISQFRFETPDIIGNSKIIQGCLTQAAKIVNSDGNVMITGETGTGKELFAKAIHENSSRRNGQFVVVDCSVLSENLIESVLFGHEKGAFTGAERSRKGLALLANGGTLFLDEVGELPESIQSSFLRVLQEKKFRPVGSEKEIYSDFRVICATNRDLDQMAGENMFRLDLLYRLKTFVLRLPPLRERKDDIPPIAMAQIEYSCRQHHIPVKELSADFIQVLEKYDWPGNVRELINAIETSVTGAHFENMLFAFHLPVNIRAQISRSSIKDDKTCICSPVSSLINGDNTIKYKDLMDNIEKEYLESLYELTHGDINELMERSGISRAALYRKLKKHCIT